VAALFALPVLLGSVSAHAQARSELELEWTSPLGCPQERELRERVRKLVGTTSSAHPLRAEGSIVPTEDRRFRLRLVVRSGELVGERVLESNSCADLAGAAAVTLGLLLRSEEPLGDLGELSPSEGAQTTTSSPGSFENAPSPPRDAAAGDEEGEAELDAERGSTSEATSTRSVRGLLRAPLFSLSVGPLPEPSLGLGLAGGVSTEGFRFLLEGRKWWKQRVEAEAFPGFGAELDRATATLRACRSLGWERFELAPCLVVSLEHLSASGTGPGVASSTESVFWLVPGVGAQGGLAVTSWFHLVATLDVQIEASRPQIVIEGLGDVTELGPAAFTVMVGPEWIL
jgi:hypothetical protein